MVMISSSSRNGVMLSPRRVRRGYVLGKMFQRTNICWDHVPTSRIGERTDIRTEFRSHRTVRSHCSLSGPRTGPPPPSHSPPAPPPPSQLSPPPGHQHPPPAPQLGVSMPTKFFPTKPQTTGRLPSHYVENTAELERILADIMKLPEYRSRDRSDVVQQVLKLDINAPAHPFYLVTAEGRVRSVDGTPKSRIPSGSFQIWLRHVDDQERLLRGSSNGGSYQ